MFNIKYLFCFLCVFLSLNLTAQSTKAYLRAADLAYDNQDFYTAMLHYEDALKEAPNRIDIQFQYAQAARQFNAFVIAEEVYQKVQNSTAALNYPTATFWLAKVQQAQGKYALAKKSFDKYARSVQPDKILLAQAKIDIGNCEWAMQLIDNQEDISIEQLNKNINTPYSEFGAVLLNDTLYYSSYRFENEEDEQYPPRRISKTLASVQQQKGRTVRGINVATQHTANVTFSKNGQRMYFTRCDNLANNDIHCQLFYTERSSRGRWKKTATKLPERINRATYTTTHPAVGFDSLTQKEILYFVSDRVGGKGGLDIWKTTVEAGKNKFSKPENVTFLNTEKDDLTPFFNTQNQTLYFSSDGRYSMGGYDIFSCQIGADTLQIDHLPPPVNSSYNDLYYAPTTDSLVAYLASNRPPAFYLDKRNQACCNDIFKVVYYVDNELVINEVVPVEVPLDTIGNVPEIAISILPQTLQDFLPLALFFDNDRPDPRTRKTTTKRTYGATYERYSDRRNDYLDAYIIGMKEEEVATAEEELETFFTEKIDRGFKFLERFSQILLKRLESGDQVEIFLKGYTSPRAKSDYNLNLSQRRISSVRNHFIEWERGILKPYLDNGTLKISEKPFGETTVTNRVSDVLADEKNSIYSPAAMQERRVEIVEIR